MSKMIMNLLVWWAVVFLQRSLKVMFDMEFHQDNVTQLLVQIQTLDAELCLVLCNRCRNERKRFFFGTFFIPGILNMNIWGVHCNACGTKSTHCPTRAGHALRTVCPNSNKNQNDEADTNSLIKHQFLFLLIEWGGSGSMHTAPLGWRCICWPFSASEFALKQGSLNHILILHNWQNNLNPTHNAVSRTVDAAAWMRFPRL